MRKLLVPWDFNQKEMLNPVLQNLGADPGSPINGQFWYLTTGSHDVRARVNGATVSLLPASLLASANTWTAANVFNGAITGNNTINLTGTGASSVGGTFAATALSAAGLTGTTGNARFVGGTNGGTPGTGTFLAGDYIVGRDGTIAVCTVGGTPGTWVLSASYLLGTNNTWSAAATFTGGVVLNSAVTGSGTLNLTGTGASSFAGTNTATAQIASGLTGATAASRYVGATASGSPASGTFAVGDYVVAQNGHFWVCTIAGTPGTWVDVATAGSLTLGSTVVTETSYGQSSAVGSGTTAAHIDHTHGTPTHVTGDHSGFSLSIFATPTADVAWGSHKITGLLDPTGPQDAATKNYVDAVASGFDPKASVRVATTGVLPNTPTYANGTAGVGATLTSSTNVIFPAVDGVSLSVGERILVKDQATQANNGIYTLTQAGSGSLPWILTRATDADQAAEVSAGMMTFVESGTVNGGQIWIQTTTGAFTIGTTAQTFTQFSGVSTTTAGAGLTATGNVIAVGAGTGITVAADSVAVDTTVVSRHMSQAIGNGSLTSIAVTHNFGNQWVNAQVFNASSPFDQQECDVQLTDANTVTFLFSVAPASNALRAVITG